MPYIDFEELKHRVSVEDVMRLIGWKPSYRDRGGYRGPCPIHKSRSPTSKSFSVSQDGFQCFTCKAKGDLIRLYATVIGVREYPAALQLAAILGVELPLKRPASPASKTGTEKKER